MNNLFMIDLTTVVGCCFAYFFFVWYALPKIVYNSIPFVKFSNCTLCFFFIISDVVLLSLSLCMLYFGYSDNYMYIWLNNQHRQDLSFLHPIRRILHVLFALFFPIVFFYYYIFMCRAMILLWFTRWESFAMRICAILCVLYTATVHSIEWLCYIGYMVMHVSI